MATPQSSAATIKRDRRERGPAYSPSYIPRARRYAFLGLTQAEAAENFGVTATTLQRWIDLHPEFEHAWRSGGIEADARVARALYLKAMGFRKKAEKIFFDGKRGTIVRAVYSEYYPPDTRAAELWLQYRQRERWSRKDEAQSSELTVVAYIDADTDELCGAPPMKVIEGKG